MDVWIYAFMHLCSYVCMYVCMDVYMSVGKKYQWMSLRKKMSPYLKLSFSYFLGLIYFSITPTKKKLVDFITQAGPKYRLTQKNCEQNDQSSKSKNLSEITKRHFWLHFFPSGGSDIFSLPTYVCM